MGQDNRRSSRWERVVAVVIAVASLITAVAALITALNGCSPA